MAGAAVARVAAIIAGGLALSFGVHTLAADSSKPADESIRAVWSTLDAAWNARDVERFSRLFAQDATFGIVPEQLVEGRAAIHARFAEQFSRQSPDLRHSTQLRRIEHLEPGLAAVDAEVHVARVAAGEHGWSAILRTFAVFAVMTRASGAWEIRGIRIYRLPEEQ